MLQLYDNIQIVNKANNGELPAEVDNSEFLIYLRPMTIKPHQKGYNNPETEKLL